MCMCWKCSHPDKTTEDYLREEVLPRIRARGWLVQAVGGSRLRAPFAYTVGLTAAGLPELVVTGLNSTRSGPLLNSAAAYYLQADPLPRHGERVCFSDGPCTEVVDLPNPEAHLFIATAVYPEAVRAQQLAWADDRGRWPWERAHRSSRGGQPVLGPRAIAAAT